MPRSNSSLTSEFMQDKALIDQLMSFAQKVQSCFTGMQVSIEQELSTAGDNYDRHFSASARFGFTLTNFAIRFSGNKMMFMGEHDHYEIHGDAITGLKELGNNSYQLLEVLSKRIYRRSTIRFMPLTSTQLNP